MQIVMPKLGLTMTEGTLTRWRKAESDRVEPGEILFEFESEKSVMEYECPAGGVLTQIAVGRTALCPDDAFINRSADHSFDRDKASFVTPVDIYIRRDQ